VLELEDSTRFLVSLDADRTWFRYHTCSRAARDAAPHQPRTCRRLPRGRPLVRRPRVAGRPIRPLQAAGDDERPSRTSGPTMTLTARVTGEDLRALPARTGGPELAGARHRPPHHVRPRRAAAHLPGESCATRRRRITVHRLHMAIAAVRKALGGGVRSISTCRSRCLRRASMPRSRSARSRAVFPAHSRCRRGMVPCCWPRASAPAGVVALGRATSDGVPGVAGLPSSARRAVPSLGAGRPAIARKPSRRRPAGGTPR